ncbi:hypothetical protein [Lacihabitans sp. CS3-21]|uniref:hypothetical protein n=1 Tax=Lacihabitans sp. CS3-21 TaxID=2487332 RepID=UPI0020CBDCB4|nr:hypothetical protein [Lacihabitans sp. CS3-21]
METNTSDFNWHDCPLYSLKFDDNLELDLDYIIKWELGDNNKYKYLIAPAILVFYEVKNFHISAKSSILNGFEINYIKKDPQNSWKIDLQEGEIIFESEGFTQKLTKKPIWSDNQYLSEKERMI